MKEDQYGRSGGVAANSALRRHLEIEEKDIQVYIPPVSLCRVLQ